MIPLNINFQEQSPSAGFDPIPVGTYNAALREGEEKPTKAMLDGTAKSGKLINAQFEILDGDYAGRRIFTSYNVENDNPVAVKIGYEQLTDLAYVTGQLGAQSFEEFLNIPIQIKVGMSKTNEQYPDPRNEIKGYRDSQGRTPVEIQKAMTGGGAPAGGSAPKAPTPPAAPGAPKAPAAPSAPAAPPVVSGLPAALADGWVVHPDTAGYHYKGSEVVADSELAARYPGAPAAPAAPPAPPAAPAAPAAPASDGKPPWVKG